MKNVFRFLGDVQREFAKVIWPTGPELMGSTLVVLALVCAFSCYLGLIDYILGRSAGAILSL